MATDPAGANALPPTSDRGAWREVARWSTDCEDAFRSAGLEGSGIEVFPLGPKRYLVQVQCDLAAYQAAFNYVLLDEWAAPPRHTLLRFPEHDGARWSMQAWVAGQPTFQPDRRELEIWSKARGLAIAASSRVTASPVKQWRYSGCGFGRATTPKFRRTAHPIRTAGRSFPWIRCDGLPRSEGAGDGPRRGRPDRFSKPPAQRKPGTRMIRGR